MCVRLCIIDCRMIDARYLIDETILSSSCSRACFRSYFWTDYCVRLHEHQSKKRKQEQRSKKSMTNKVFWKRNELEGDVFRTLRYYSRLSSKVWVKNIWPTGTVSSNLFRNGATFREQLVTQWIIWKIQCTARSRFTCYMSWSDPSQVVVKGGLICHSQSPLELKWHENQRVSCAVFITTEL